MNTKGFAIWLIGAAATGCSSDPPTEGLPQAVMVPEGRELTEPAGQFMTLPQSDQEAPVAEVGPSEPPVAEQDSAEVRRSTTRKQYEVLSALPEAEAREVRFRLNSQTFEYAEDGRVILNGPITSGKSSSPTPKGSFAVLSKHKDKESSRYTNEIGTQAWMPFSMQFHGNYFMHEGWLAPQPASHGCVRLGHYDARLLFERMKIGDRVKVTN